MDSHQQNTAKRENNSKLDPIFGAARFVPRGRSSSTNEQLEVSKKRFEKLIEQAPDAFFAHDLQGNLLQVNEQACQQLGYQRHELLALNVCDIQRGIEPELAKTLWQKVMDGETVLAEDVLLRKDGSTFPAEVKIGLFKDGNTIEIFGFFRNFTERKRREEEREALIARLQEALEEVKQLSGMLPICAHCHKIRDDEGYWNRLETYFQNRSDIAFSHGICPECVKQHHPNVKIKNKFK